MKLISLDKNFNVVSVLQYINLQWNRDYYNIGTFSVQMLEKDYNPQSQYLYTAKRPEMGIIQKVELSTNIKGRFINLSGFFLEDILNDKITHPTYYANGPIDGAIISMIKKHKQDIPLLNVLDSQQTAENVCWQSEGEELGTVAFTQLQTQQMSLRCTYLYDENRIDCFVWQGLDRTQVQSANNFVVFSDGFKNLEKVFISTDESNYKNYAVVAGEGETGAQTVAYADLSAGGYKRQLFVDASSEKWNSSEQTYAQYLQALQQKGFSVLLDYQKINNVEVDVTTSNFKYLSDFDLGDKVDVVIDSMGLYLQARVVCVYEVFKQNHHTITLELGDKRLTAIKKARLYK